MHVSFPALFKQVEEEESPIVYLAWKVFSKEVLKELHRLSLEDQSKSGQSVLKLIIRRWHLKPTTHKRLRISFSAEK